MKVLWLGHYREQSGWADATVNSILALDSVGVEVVPRNVSLTGSMSEVPSRILELEKNSTEDADICIQNILPHCMVATDNFRKNIGYVVTEGYTIAHTPWVKHLNAMTDVWVPNRWNQYSMINDLDIDDIYTVPYAFDITKYSRVINKINLDEHNDKFKFYYIGDVNDRKNLPTLIKCFHAAFWDVSDVALVLKVNRHGLDEKQLSEYMQKMCSGVRESLRILPTEAYHKEIIIPARLSDEQLLALHNTCDCFVSASHSEGWGIPSFDAMCFGNTPICCKEGGPADYIGDVESGHAIDFVLSPCTYRDAAFPFINTAEDRWANIDEEEMMAIMKYEYRLWKDGKRDKSLNRKAGLQQAKSYDYETIGETMKRLLK